MKEPASAVKAVLLPREMAPRPREMMEQRRVAGMGQLRFSLTLEKDLEKGVALSRARDHQTRPQVTRVPTRQMRRERRTMNTCGGRIS